MRATLYTAAVAIMLGIGYAACQTPSTRPPVNAPDPTWEMVNEDWATFQIEGQRQSWGRPSQVSMMLLYEPRVTPGTPKEYALFWWVGARQMREDFDSREKALELVRFIIENSTKQESAK